MTYLFTGKIIGNLKRYSSEESIIKETLNTLSELSMGYSYVRMLTKLDNVKQLLCTHNKTGMSVFIRVGYCIKKKKKHFEKKFYCFALGVGLGLGFSQLTFYLDLSNPILHNHQFIPT